MDTIINVEKDKGKNMQMAAIALIAFAVIIIILFAGVLIIAGGADDKDKSDNQTVMAAGLGVPSAPEAKQAETSTSASATTTTLPSVDIEGDKKQESLESVAKEIQEKNKEEAKQVLALFLEAAQGGESINNYVYIEKEGYVTEEYFMEEQKRRIKEIKEKFSSPAKAKITKLPYSEYYFKKYPGEPYYGTSIIVVKVCDVDGFCERFKISLEWENHSRWKIYEIKRLDQDSFDMYRKRKIFATTFQNPALQPSKTVKEFFSLIKNGKHKEAQELFTQRRGPGSEISYLVQMNELVSFDEVKIVYEDTRETVGLGFLLRDQQGSYEKGGIYLIKRPTGEWKITDFSIFE